MSLLTFDDLREHNISLEHMFECVQLRNAARLERITLKMNEPLIPLFQHLVDYLTMCSTEIEKYLNEGFYELQPYMITKVVNTGAITVIYCILDDLYPVIAEVETGNEYTYVTTYFDMGNNDSFNLTDSISKYDKDKVFTFNDVLLDKQRGEVLRTAKIFSQCGLKTFPLAIPVLCVKQVGPGYYGKCVANRKTMNEKMSEWCDMYARDLYFESLYFNTFGIDLTNVNIKELVEQIDFGSYNKHTPHGVVFLIRGLLSQRDWVSMGCADFAICFLLRHIKITEEQKQELLLEVENEIQDIDSYERQLILNRLRVNLRLPVVGY